MASKEPQVVVLYGRETNNTEDIAKRIVWEGIRRRCLVVARPLDHEPFDSLTSPSAAVFLFILSTMGQGQVPVGAQPFWKKLMRKNLTAASLSHLQCAVIGLGDSSYPQFNFVGKKLFKRLKMLGSKMFLDLCLGDDQHDYGYDGSVEPFLEKFWAKVKEMHKLPSFTLAHDFIPDSTFEFLEVDNVENGGHFDGNNSDEIASEANPFEATIISCERVTTAEHFQDVRHIKIQSDSRIHHEAGDVIAVLPENDPTEVLDFLKLLNLNPEEKVVIKKRDPQTQNPVSFTYRFLEGCHTLLDLLSKHFDIHAVPKRCFFYLLWRFSPDEVEKEKLKEMASNEGQEELYEYCLKPKRTIIEVLRDFPKTSAAIPSMFLPDLLPGIKFREFSIASSLNVVPNEIHLLMAVVQYKTRIREPRTGLCSNFLSRVKPRDSVRVWINKGSLVVPIDSTPVVMIGPGTGVAPFRSIIQERISKGFMDNTLFFGCRYSKRDYFFQEDWREYQERGGLNLITAFSRDQERKVYVQHRMREHSQHLFDLIAEKDAVILVAGTSNKMPEAVREALVSIIEEKSPGAGESFVTSMENKKRLQYECWD
jgi:sulfite reductase alpha subunit-like flavoprotein